VYSICNLFDLVTRNQIVDAYDMAAANMMDQNQLYKTDILVFHARFSYDFPAILL
jgi:hypothetical protein